MIFFLLSACFHPHLVSTASIIQPPRFQKVTEENLPTPICVGADDWLGTRYGPQDCERAVETLILKEVRVHGSQEYEFLGPEAQPFHALPIMQTPRRYTVGPNASSFTMPFVSS